MELGFVKDNCVQIEVIVGLAKLPLCQSKLLFERN